MKLVLATHNQGKIRELKECLAKIGWEVVPINEISDVPEPQETGDTFEENALQKAHYYMKAVNLPVLSDDSGIIADVLGNEPGIYSARYAGVHGNDDANNEKLIKRLAHHRDDERKGHYECVMAVVFPDGHEIVTKGTCYGIIRDTKRGTGGFGYDPLFYIPEKGKTMAELTMEEKNEISHRGKALRAMVKELKKNTQYCRIE